MIQFLEAIERHCKGKKYATKQIYRRIGRSFDSYCKVNNINWQLAKYHDILGYKEHLQLQKGIVTESGHSTYANRTIRRALVITAAVYRRNHIDFSIFDEALRLVPVSLKPQKRVTSFVPFDQVMKLFEACGDDKAGMRNKAYMAMCFGGAMRTSEATAVKVGDIRKSLKGTVYIHIEDTKTNQAAQQIIVPSVLPHLEAYRQIRLLEGAKPGDPFLTAYDFTNTYPTHKHINRKRMYNIFIALCEKVLGRSLGTHSMRATAITKMIADGVPHRRVQDFSRHGTISMVELYDKLLNDIDNSPAKNLSFA